MICSKCNTNIFSEDLLTCCFCKANFHFACGGQTERNFRNMKEVNKAHYKCFDCKFKTSPPKQQPGSDLTSGIHPATIQTASTQQIEATGLMNKAYFEERFKEMIQSMSNNKEELIHVLQEKIMELERKIEQRDEKIQNLEERLELLENRSRICNIEVRGMPETKNEDVVKVIEEIGRTIGVSNIEPGDIQVAHRVDSRNQAERGKRPIIAHLRSRYLRNIWIQKYREYRKTKANRSQTPANLTAKDVNGQLPDVNIYLNEHITVERKLLLAQAKSFAKAKDIQYVWIKEGFILMKKNENEKRVQKIGSKRELEEFMKNFNSAK